MRVLLTCGPASSAIDAVRRLTNLSTGELGARLAGRLSLLHHEVTCFRGSGAVFPAPPPPVRHIPFSGNSDLLEKLGLVADSPTHVLHAAALADFDVHSACVDGVDFPTGVGKIRSSAEEVIVRLRPAPKLITRLRQLFPDAYLAGWKYEVEGTREAAAASGILQIEQNRLDACIVNGPALGTELLAIDRFGNRTSFPDRDAFLEGSPKFFGL